MFLEPPSIVRGPQSQCLQGGAKPVVLQTEAQVETTFPVHIAVVPIDRWHWIRAWPGWHSCSLFIISSSAALATLLFPLVGY